MVDNAGTIAGVMIAGYVGQAILNTVSLSHEAKFSSYGVDMFTWEFGGVTVSILKDFSDGLARVVSSVDGTPQEQQGAINDVVKMLDNMAIRQLVPFAKQALSVVESVTGRSYISPIYEAFTKVASGVSAQQTKVQRTFIESLIHGILTTDPNKSKDVREWTYKKMIQLQVDAMSEKNPVYQKWFQARYEHFKYLNDLFMRYEPIEVYENFEKRRMERDKKEGEEYYDKMRYKWDHQERLRSRKSDMGYLNE